MALFSKHRHHQTDDAEAPDPTEITLEDEIQTVHRVMQWYRPGEGIRFGAATRCPECGANGFVVSSDTITGNCINYCLECHADWLISLRALEAVAAAGPPPAPVATAPAPPQVDYLYVEDDLAIEATPAVLDAFLAQPAAADEHDPRAAST